MKKTILSLALLLAAVCASAQSALTSRIILTPYIEHDAQTPTADKVLMDKLNRIVSKHGVSSSNGIQSPFIITAHAIELNKETTATAPPQTAVELSLTLYIGNGEEGVMFSTCNMILRGVGSGTDKAYASAFKRINVNDPEILAAIDEAETRIAKYYAEQGPALIQKARALGQAGNYSEAYATLLRIPTVCPQHNEAQALLLELVSRESDEMNSRIITQARGAWSANPTEAGAAEAASILDGMQNASPKLRSEADQLLAEIARRFQSVADEERRAEQRRAENAHAEEMAAIESATKIAVAKAKNQPTYHYHIHWW